MYIQMIWTINDCSLWLYYKWPFPVFINIYFDHLTWHSSKQSNKICFLYCWLSSFQIKGIWFHKSISKVLIQSTKSLKFKLGAQGSLLLSWKLLSTFTASWLISEDMQGKVLFWEIPVNTWLSFTLKLMYTMVFGIKIL